MDDAIHIRLLSTDTINIPQQFPTTTNRTGLYSER